MNTTILLLACSIMFANSSVAHTASHVNDQISSCDRPKICGPHGTCEITDKSAQCKCQHGYRGIRCEQFVSNRCRIYSRQHGRLQTSCIEGQWCMPDNFYYHFYPCQHAQGWCMLIRDIRADAQPDDMDDFPLD